MALSEEVLWKSEASFFHRHYYNVPYFYHLPKVHKNLHSPFLLHLGWHLSFCVIATIHLGTNILVGLFRCVHLVHFNSTLGETPGSSAFFIWGYWDQLQSQFILAATRFCQEQNYFKFWRWLLPSEDNGGQVCPQLHQFHNGPMGDQVYLGSQPIRSPPGLLWVLHWWYHYHLGLSSLYCSGICVTLQITALVSPLLQR